MESSRFVRRAALSCALATTLVCPRQTTAGASAPDYTVKVTVQPFTTSGPITIVYVCRNRGRAQAAPTTVKFTAAPHTAPTAKTVLGQAPVPALGPEASLTQTVAFPLPGGLPVGTTNLSLTPPGTGAYQKIGKGGKNKKRSRARLTKIQ